MPQKPYQQFNKIPQLPNSLVNYNENGVMVTVGPTFSDEKTISEALILGVNLFRLPFGYKTFDFVRVMSLIKSSAEMQNKNVMFIADLPSGRPRISSINEYKIKSNDIIYFKDCENLTEKSNSLIGVSGLNIILDKVSIKNKIQMLDGKVSLEVQDNSNGVLKCLVVYGNETIKSGNSLVFCNLDCIYPMVLKDDIKLIKNIEKEGINIDYLIFSMINSHEDISNGKLILSKSGINKKIFAKIETRAAVNNINSIINKSDGVLIGRGDLGLDVDILEIPTIEKNIISIARNMNKICYVGTSFMEDCSNNGELSRNEAEAISSVFFSGADGIMLGKETVYSKYPIYAIKKVLEAQRNCWVSGQLWLKQATQKKSSIQNIAIEGPNGVGKSTILNEMIKKYKDSMIVRAVHPLFEEKNIKSHILASDNWKSSVLYFYSALLEQVQEFDYSLKEKLIFTDKSIWSTPAVHASFNPKRLNFCFKILNEISGELSFPDLTIYLDASYSLCNERRNYKLDDVERINDLNGPQGEVAHYRERDFFVWLKDCGVPIAIIDASLPLEEKVLEIEKEIKKWQNF